MSRRWPARRPPAGVGERADGDTAVSYFTGSGDGTIRMYGLGDSQPSG